MTCKVCQDKGWIACKQINPRTLKPEVVKERCPQCLGKT